MNIRIRLTSYYSHGDEKRFFDGLKKNPAVGDVRGIGRDLIIRIKKSSLNQDATRDLIALLWRYGITLKPLRVLSREKKFAWLRDKDGYWHKSMFSAA